MPEFIESADDVIALTISRELTGGDLKTRAIDCIELSGLASYTARAEALAWVEGRAADKSVPSGPEASR